MDFKFRDLRHADWRATCQVMLVRWGAAALAVFVVVAIPLLIKKADTAAGGGVDVIGYLIASLAIPALSTGATLLLVVMSRLGVPFAGLLSYFTAIPNYMGDPLVWVLHKFRPDLVPVDEIKFINRPLLFVFPAG